jgi:hypothetical protein
MYYLLALLLFKLQRRWGGGGEQGDGMGTLENCGVERETMI